MEKSFAVQAGREVRILVKPDEIEWISTQKDSASNLTGGVSNWEKLRPEDMEVC